MVTLHKGPHYIIDNSRIAAPGEPGLTPPEEAKKQTLTYQVLEKHNHSGNMEHLQIKFDCMGVYDNTYVGILQTAYASGLKEFPMPCVFTNCHNCLCAVGGTINTDVHKYAESACVKSGGIFVPPHEAVIHQYMREMMINAGDMAIVSDSHTRYGTQGSVSIGEGIGEIFKGLGVDYLIEGGQTMNPSTEDMLNAIDQVNADHIFILPNNKNIILAANQAKALCKDKDIIVIPTKTVPQGITAMINYMPDSSAEENEARMSEEIGNVKTGQVTYAVRDTHIDDKEIKEGDIMGIGDHAILSVGQDVAETTLAMFAELIDEDSELISIYYGADVQEADAQKLGEALGEKYPDCDVEVHFGGQPIYYYVVSVE